MKNKFSFHFYIFLCSLIFVGILAFFSLKSPVNADYPCGGNMCNDDGVPIYTISEEGCGNTGPCGDPFIYPPAAEADPPTDTTTQQDGYQSDEASFQQSTGPGNNGNPTQNPPPGLFYTIKSFILNLVTDIPLRK